MSIRSNRTRASIIKSARLIFSTYGKNGTRMTQIALQAGVNKASIFYHFRSKDNLYRIVFQSSLKHVVKNIYNCLLKSRLRQKDDSVDDILNQFWGTHPQILKLFIHELIRGAPELHYVLSTENKYARETLDKLAAMFSMLEIKSNQDMGATDEFYIRKATQIIAHSMSQQLVDKVIDTIFTNPQK
jgi:AcrR family transcriptional regulator